MTRIGRLFEDLKKADRKGLIAYLTVGDPSPDRTPALVEALVRGGADLIELGVPFSDPLADGPVIQAAGERALKAVGQCIYAFGENGIDYRPDCFCEPHFRKRVLAHGKPL